MRDSHEAWSSGSDFQTLKPLVMLLADQRRRWQQGERMLVEAYLLERPDLAANAEGLLDLIYNEVFLREQRGEAPQCDEYVARFPQFAAELKDQFALHRVLEQDSLHDATQVNGHEDPAATLTIPGGFGEIPPAIAGYEILDVLGHGGMGVVYKARHMQLKRLVALKMILAGPHAGPEHLARFRSEAEAVARLQHPHIVQIYEVGEQDGLPFFSLEFVDGGSLAQHLRGTPLPARQAAELVETLAQAMYYAHQRGVIHRDLKPANIMLQRSVVSCQLSVVSRQSSEVSGQWSEVRSQEMASDGGPPLTSDLRPLTADLWPKITDFGLAKKLDAEPGSASEHHTRIGSILGTPSYMAPEQAQGNTQQIGPAADIYALGAILYELLTGRPPFKADSPLNTVLQVALEEPVAPSRLQSKVPRDLETICLKCLEKHPGRRYATAETLADDLHHFLNGEPILARPVRGWERTLKWARRRPAIAALSLLSLLVTIVGFAGISWEWGLAVAARQEATQKAEDETRAKEDAQRAWQEEAAARLREADQRRQAEEAQGRAVHAQQEEQAARRREAEQHREADRLLARLTVDQGRSLCEQGDAGRGMLWLARGLEIAPEDAADVDWGSRSNLAAWRHQLHPLRACLEHQGQVEVLAYSPNSKTFLTAGFDNVARLWDAATGKPLAELPQPSVVQSAVFSPDSNVLLIGYWNHTARRWNVQEGKQVGPNLRHASRVNAVAYSPNGTTFLTACDDGTVRLWSALTNKLVCQPLKHRRAVVAVCYSPTGKTFLTASRDRTAQVWDAGTGAAVGPPLPHDDEVAAVAYSPDGATVLTASHDKTARLWDAATGTLRHTLTHPSGVIAAAYGPDGKTVLTGTWNKTAWLWDADTGKAIGTPLAHQDLVHAVAYSPDGKTLLTGSFDGTARLWDAVTTQPVGPPLRHQKQILAVAYSPDGRTVLTGSADKTARLWDATPGKLPVEAFPPQGDVRAVAFSPDGRFVLTGSQDRTAQLWGAATRKPVNAPLLHEAEVAAVAFSPDGKVLLTGSWDKTARLWDAATAQALGDPLRHEERVYAVAFSPDGKTVLTGSGNDRRGEARLWDATTHQPLGDPLPHQGEVRAVAFSPNGKLILTGSFDRTARLWETATGELLHELRHPGWIPAVAFSPDGRTVLTGCWDRTAHLWDADTGRPLGEPLQHDGEVVAVTFSPNGKTILTGSWDRTARLWETATGKPIGPPLRHPDYGVHAVAFSPDGRSLLTGSLTARLWAVAPVSGSVERIVLWTQVLSGMELGFGGGVEALDAATWRQRGQRLQEMGGPPVP